MGTCMGPSYACLFMGYVEHSLFQSYSGPQPQLFLQYIAAIIGAASLSCPKLEKFIDFISSFHPAFIFTWSISDFSLIFLDISFSISGDRLTTNIQYKPTDSHSYLDYTSSQLASCKDSIPFSQFLHVCYICSHVANIDKGPSEMSTFLNRGFPRTVVDSALNGSDPSLTLPPTPFLPSRNSDRVPLVLTSIHIQKIIRRHFCHLQRDAT
eukprot:g15502.t1